MGAEAPFETKAEWVYGRLRDDIVDGRRKAGQRLRLASLAEQFSTSPMPVREALRMLQRDGLVEIESHRGATVAEISWERAYEAVAVRMHLEVLAVEQAVPHQDPESLSRAGRLVDRMDELAASGNAMRFSQANRELHATVEAPCPLRLLLEEIDALWDLVWRTRSRSLFTLIPARMTEAQHEHRAIIDAIRRGDARAARAATEDHRDRTLAAWREAIKAADARA